MPTQPARGALLRVRCTHHGDQSAHERLPSIDSLEGLGAEESFDKGGATGNGGRPCLLGTSRKVNSRVRHCIVLPTTRFARSSRGRSKALIEGASWSDGESERFVRFAFPMTFPMTSPPMTGAWRDARASQAPVHIGQAGRPESVRHEMDRVLARMDKEFLAEPESPRRARRPQVAYEPGTVVTAMTTSTRREPFVVLSSTWSQHETDPLRRLTAVSVLHYDPQDDGNFLCLPLQPGEGGFTERMTIVVFSLRHFDPAARDVRLVALGHLAHLTRADYLANERHHLAEEECRRQCSIARPTLDRLRSAIQNLFRQPE